MDLHDSGYAPLVLSGFNVTTSPDFYHGAMTFSPLAVHTESGKILRLPSVPEAFQLPFSPDPLVSVG